MKFLSIAYFVILFCILGSYLAFMTPNNAIRLHVATADKLSNEQSNIILVQARNVDNGSQFNGYTLEARWIKSDFSPVSDIASTHAQLPLNGETIMKMPDLPDTEVGALEILLLDDKKQIAKSAIVPSTTFLLTPISEPLDLPDKPMEEFYLADSPSAFMFNVPNEILVATVNSSGPYKGEISVEQIYGQKADFNPSFHTEGMTTFSIALQAVADFKFTAGDHVFYASFAPNEKPFQATVKSPLLLPEQATVVNIVPVGSMPTFTVDYFDDYAWIDRQTITPENAAHAELKPNNRFLKQPSIIYARVSNSPIATPQGSQMFALIASNSPLTDADQAAFALRAMEKLKAAHLEYPYLQKLLKNRKLAPFIRDYALSVIASHHTPQIEMRVKTEVNDAMTFERQKNTQKSVANIVLVSWFALGVIVCLAIIIHSSRRRKQMWEELIASGEVDVNQIPKQTSAMQLFCLLILITGMLVSLYFMMQIV